MLNIKTGDTVYFIEKYGRAVEDGLVKEIVEYPEGMAVELKLKYGSITRLVKDIFKTQAEAVRVRDMILEAEKEEYRKMITDVPSLVKFMFEHTVCQCEEYTDWEAREVVEEKAKELLNLSLERE